MGFGAGRQLTGKGRGRQACPDGGRGRGGVGRRRAQEDPPLPSETEKVGGGAVSWGQVVKAQ